MKTCLIVVDLQKGFINASSDYVVERIERLLDKKHLIWSLQVSSVMKETAHSCN